MSVPRKITTARRIGSGRRDILTAETTMSMGYVDANTYHHDDVVQELQLAAWEVNRLLNITHGRDLSWRQMLDGANGRLGRALAKIAQEG